MKALQKINYGIILLLLFMVHANCEIIKSGQTGLQFLQAGASARAEGMGGAYTLAGKGAEAIFYNPAGMVLMDSDFDISANHIKWIADMAYTAASIAYRPASGKYGTFGLSLRAADYGDFIGTVVDNTIPDGFRDSGIFSPTALSIGFAYAKQLTNRFMVGGQVKYVEQSLGSSVVIAGGNSKENKISGVVFDFGTIYHTGIKSLNFGMDIRNFAGDFKYEIYQFEAPLEFRIGISFNLMDIFIDENSKQALLLALDTVHPRDDSEHLDIGLEYNLKKMFYLRGGYRVGYDLRSYTIGAGLNLNLKALLIHFDYSFGALEYFDNVQQFTIGFSF